MIYFLEKVWVQTLPSNHLFYSFSMTTRAQQVQPSIKVWSYYLLNISSAQQVSTELFPFIHKLQMTSPRARSPSKSYAEPKIRWQNLQRARQNPPSPEHLPCDQEWGVPCTDLFVRSSAITKLPATTVYSVFWTLELTPMLTMIPDKAFIFLHYPTVDDAIRAIPRLQRLKINKHPMVVRFSITPHPLQDISMTSLLDPNLVFAYPIQYHSPTHPNATDLINPDAASSKLTIKLTAIPHQATPFKPAVQRPTTLADLLSTPERNSDQPQLHLQLETMATILTTMTASLDHITSTLDKLSAQQQEQHGILNTLVLAMQLHTAMTSAAISPSWMQPTPTESYPSAIGYGYGHQTQDK